MKASITDSYMLLLATVNVALCYCVYVSWFGFHDWEKENGD